jgi:hypothetical protein
MQWYVKLADVLYTRGFEDFHRSTKNFETRLVEKYTTRSFITFTLHQRVRMIIYIKDNDMKGQFLMHREVITAYKNSVWKPEGKQPLARH